MYVASGTLVETMRSRLEIKGSRVGTKWVSSCIQEISSHYTSVETLRFQVRLESESKWSRLATG
ncbi:hypothetical protein HanIR_Chr16g0787651 [Helianthus annuus]|nr:hypothetical protein HanIR_Chr16g0787651 [Helianthus annuus]